MRNDSDTFVAEGPKVVAELLRSSMKVREIFATDDWIAENASKFSGVLITSVTDAEMERLSAMQTACNVVAEVEKMPSLPFALDANSLYLALDSVRDPGNLGTIIRIANWFGISTVLASNDCVDVYSPKVIQASMGSAFRVKVQYCDLPETLSEAHKIGLPVYGTFLDGENIYATALSRNGIVVLGNEGHGILPQTAGLVSKRILIPCGARADEAPESLNVATATSIVCSEFFRRTLI